jgi:hypothetical protein
MFVGEGEGTGMMVGIGSGVGSGHMITVGDGFVEGKGILENYEGHDMFIVSGSGSGTGISVTGALRRRLSLECVMVVRGVSRATACPYVCDGCAPLQSAQRTRGCAPPLQRARGPSDSKHVNASAAHVGISLDGRGLQTAALADSLTPCLRTR